MKKQLVTIITTIFVLLLGACAAPLEESAAETARLVESERVVSQSALIQVTAAPTEEAAPMEEEKDVEPIDTTQLDAGTDADGAQRDSAAAVTFPAAIQSLAAGIMSDAAERSGVSAEKLTTIAAEPVTWNDGSLGCPQPDMMYTMALIEGYRLVVSAEGQQLAYHTDGGTHFVYCENADK